METPRGREEGGGGGGTKCKAHTKSKPTPREMLGAKKDMQSSIHTSIQPSWKKKSLSKKEKSPPARAIMAMKRRRFRRTRDILQLDYDRNPLIAPPTFATSILYSRFPKRGSERVRFSRSDFGQVGCSSQSNPQVRSGLRPAGEEQN